MIISKQKYRMHRRHILPKEDDRRWSQQRSYYQHKPIMAYPPPHSNHTFQLSPVYPVWGAAAGQPPGVQMWCSSPGYSPWLPSESWYWKPYPGVISTCYFSLKRLMEVNCMSIVINFFIHFKFSCFRCMQKHGVAR